MLSNFNKLFIALSIYLSIIISLITKYANLSLVVVIYYNNSIGVTFTITDAIINSSNNIIVMSISISINRTIILVKRFR